MGRFDIKDGKILFDSSKWKNFRSFFFKADGNVKLDFYSSNLTESITTRVRDGKLNIRELLVYKGENLQTEENKFYNKKAHEIFEGLIDRDAK